MIYSVFEQEDPIEEEYLSFFKSLKDLNPDKLKQLKGRFVTPLTSTGPVPQPKFLGVQELYQKFIENALRTGFYTILEMNLIHDIIELNETKFVNSEIEGTGKYNQNSVQHKVNNGECGPPLPGKKACIERG